MHHSVEQGLVQLEICATKLAEIKTNLRTNFEKVQQEIGQVMSAEISMIKNREAQLLQQLSEIHQEKEDKLGKHQALVQSSIGMCQQAIRSNHNLRNKLFDNEICNVDDDVRIEFEADIIGSKNFIENLGTIRSATDCRRQEVQNVGVTLPRVFEKYDDDTQWLMAKKSTEQLVPSRFSSFAVPRRNFIQNEHVTAEDFVVTDPFSDTCDESESSSSFELINDAKESRSSSMNCHLQSFLTQQKAPLSSKFLASLERPMKEWLIETSKKCEDLPPPPVPKNLMHKFQSIPSSSTRNFDIGEIIRNVQNSDDKKWIINQPTQHQEEEIPNSNVSTTKHLKERDNNSFWLPKFGKTEKVDDLSQLFTCSLSTDSSKRRRIVPESVPSDIQTWREIVNLMHAKREWVKKD